MLKLDIETIISTKYLKKRPILKAFVKVLSNPFITLFLPVAEKLQNQIFLTSSEGTSIDNHAKPYGLERLSGESDNDFIDRILLRKLLLRNCSVSTIFYLNIGIIPQVIRASDKTIFTVGVTPLGVGVSINSLYRAFVWEATLPDLSAEEPSIYIKKKIRKQLDHLYPSIQIVIYEDRLTGLYKWEV